MSPLCRLLALGLLFGLAAFAAAQQSPPPSGASPLPGLASQASPTPSAQAVRPTVTPTPPPAATRAPAVPLNMLDQNQLKELVRRRTPEVAIELQQVRVVRTRNVSGAAAAGAIGVTTLTGDGTMQNLFRPGIALVFRVHTPTHCGILDFKNVRLTELTDQQGRPIRLDQPAGQPQPAGKPSAIGESNIISWERTEALIQFNAGLPPRGDERLGRLAGELTVDVGVVQPIEVRDLRAKVGQTLLDRPDGVNLTVRLESFTDDKIVLVSEGTVKRLGEFEFYGGNGEPVLSFANTVDVQAVQPDGHPRQISTYSFISIPQVLTLRINYYPKIESKKLQIAYEQLPLP
jgi:hypothetical protein